MGDFVHNMGDFTYMGDFYRTWGILHNMGDSLHNMGDFTYMGDFVHNMGDLT